MGVNAKEKKSATTKAVSVLIKLPICGRKLTPNHVQTQETALLISGAMKV